MNDGKLLIADLGLSKKLVEITSNSMANDMGLVEYIDPQRFKIKNFKKNKKSDVYSLGVLLWEISSGHPPFSNRDGFLLVNYISNGHREKPIKGTPLKYQQLYQKCWNVKPNSRPDIEKVYETLGQLKTKVSCSSQPPKINEQELRKSYFDVNDHHDDLSIDDYQCSGSKFINFIINYI